jgi:ribonuclease T1
MKACKSLASFSRIIRGGLLLLAAFGLQLLSWNSFAGGQQQDQVHEVKLADLPTEAQDTLRLIKKGGPFPYQRDGIVFGNFERQLPIKQRGYYHEYTVPTPRSRDRGARRIIAGRSAEYYYTDDHYKTFRRIRE